MTTIKVLHYEIDYSPKGRLGKGSFGLVYKAKNINKELPALKLENAKFQTFIEHSEPSNSGIDKVTFKIQTNPKSEMDLIKNIYYEGELCKFALANKVIAQKKNQTEMVFDEVDSGIGGAV